MGDVGYRLKLVHLQKGSLPEGIKSYAVPLDHDELDSLVGRLMQMCDLIGDVEQRKALKDTIKRTCRDWLDDMYQEAGYDKWGGVTKNAVVIED